ncbi:MAG: hypothetical protein J6P34_05600 [Paludibacteraceae bacterium]|nr:hypothetical protein [Paludibacteraceae bacterium]
MTAKANNNSSGATINMCSATTASLSVTLTGESGTQQYSWSVSPNSGVSIDNSSSSTPTATFSAAGTYTFTVKVGCDVSGSDHVTDNVTVTVSDYTYNVATGGWCGGSWATSGCEMTYSNSVYSKVIENLSAGTYEFKINRCNSWDWSKGYSNGTNTNSSGHIVSTTIDTSVGENNNIRFTTTETLNVTVYYDGTDAYIYTERPACATVCDKTEESFSTLMVGASEDKTFTFEYGEGIIIGSVSITGTDASQFAVESVSTSGNVAEVVVTHHPTSPGTHNASISIPYTGTSSGTHSKSISAEAKTYYVKGIHNEWGDNYPMISSDGVTYSYTFTDITQGQSNALKIYSSDTDTWYTKSGAVISRSNNSATINEEGGTGNDVTFNADIAGNYTFTFNATSKVVTVTYPCPASYTTNYNVTGGGLYCDSDLPIGLSGSQNGYLYKLYKGSDAVDTQTGGGSALSFTSQSAAGTYTVKVTAAAGCPEESVDDGTTSSVTITSGTHPDKDYFVVSDNDLTYNGTAQQATVESYDTDVYNPASITVKYGSSSGTSDKTDADDYDIYVTAASAVGNFCAVTSAIELDDKLTISKVTPSASNKDEIFDISGVPATVTYNGEGHGATVNWKSGYSDVGARTIYYKKGSEDATNTAPVNAGTYAVTVDVAAEDNNYASASPISLGDIVINKANQSTVTVTNAGNYCSGSSITATAEGGTGTGAISFTKVSGPDGITINSSTGEITARTTGSIVVTATRAGDDNYNASAASAEATFTIKAAPTAYILTGDGGSSETKICSAGGTLTLSGSQTNYSYQLKKDGSLYGDAKAGTGSALEFTVNESGVFTCEAYLTGSPDCKTTMDGSVTLHISLTPNLIPATPTVTSYTPLVITSINTDIMTWTISGAGNTAYLYNQTANTITVKAAKANSAYTITATTHGGCEATVTLTVVDDTETCNN